jgi:hypothetical protein
MAFSLGKEGTGLRAQGIGNKNYELRIINAGAPGRYNTKPIMSQGIKIFFVINASSYEL